MSTKNLIKKLNAEKLEVLVAFGLKEPWKCAACDEIKGASDLSVDVPNGILADDPLYLVRDLIVEMGNVLTVVPWCLPCASQLLTNR